MVKTSNDEIVHTDSIYIKGDVVQIGKIILGHVKFEEPSLWPKALELDYVGDQVHKKSPQKLASLSLLHEDDVSQSAPISPIKLTTFRTTLKELLVGTSFTFMAYNSSTITHVYSKPQTCTVSKCSLLSLQ